MPLIKRFPPVTNQSSVDIWELARQTLAPLFFSLPLTSAHSPSLCILSLSFSSLVCLPLLLPDFHSFVIPSFSLRHHALSLHLLELAFLLLPPHTLPHFTSSLSVHLYSVAAGIGLFIAGKLTERGKSQWCPAELHLCNNVQSALQPSSGTEVNWSGSNITLFGFIFFVPSLGQFTGIASRKIEQRHLHHVFSLTVLW